MLRLYYELLFTNKTCNIFIYEIAQLSSSLTSGQGTNKTFYFIYFSITAH